MIDLEKEREAFKQKMINEHPDYFSWIGTDSDFTIWQMCAEEKQAEINDLKQQLAEAHASRASWVEYSQKIESGEFVLVPREPTFAMTESGLMTLKKSESGYYIGSVEHIFKAMLEAVEKDDKPKD